MRVVFIFLLLTGSSMAHDFTPPRDMAGCYHYGVSVWHCPQRNAANAKIMMRRNPAPRSWTNDTNAHDHGASPYTGYGH